MITKALLVVLFLVAIAVDEMSALKPMKKSDRDRLLKLGAEKTKEKREKKAKAGKGRVLVAPPKSSAALHGKFNEPTERAKEMFRQSPAYIEATRLAVEELTRTKRQTGSTVEQIQQNDFIFTYPIEIPVDICDPRPPCDTTTKFRTASGWCNNLQKPEQAASHSLFKRILAPVYQDGIDEPRKLSVTGAALPSARDITTKVFNVLNNRESTTRTHWMMQWGQFLDHDITLTAAGTTFDGEEPFCAACDSNDFQDLCFPIKINQPDPHFPNNGTGCLHFGRSGNARLGLGAREQLSLISNYIDASQVYGSDDCKMAELREFVDGRMKTTNTGLRLPTDPNDGSCRAQSPTDCFVAGDIRVNEMFGLTSTHTLWVREHNRIATGLKGVNPSWDDERLFQEARRIVIALHEQIAYYEFLPKVVGDALFQSYALRTMTFDTTRTYNAWCDATLSNEFATAAYRFGHSLVQTLFQLRTQNAISQQIPLVETFFNPSSLYTANNIEQVLKGLSVQPSQMCDTQFSVALRDRLFESIGTAFSGTDLPALNIQRGRDHGLPSYTEYVRRYRGTAPTSFSGPFNSLSQVMDASVVAALQATYANVADIDLFVGIVAETPLAGGLLGFIGSTILMDDFIKLKQCDRFWYENSQFTPAQLVEIKKIKFSKVLCTHTNFNVQPDVFSIPSGTNPITSCGSLPALNLALWKET